MRQLLHALMLPPVRSLTVAITLCAATMFLVGCNTMEGAGKDIQGAGEAIEDAAD